jgi:hypothetical protein
MSAADILAEGLDSLEQRLSMEIGKRFEGDQNLQDQIAAFLRGLKTTWSSTDPLEGLAASAGTQIFTATIGELCSQAWLDENIRDNQVQFYAFADDPGTLPGFAWTNLSGHAQIAKLVDGNGNSATVQLVWLTKLSNAANNLAYILFDATYDMPASGISTSGAESLNASGIVNPPVDSGIVNSMTIDTFSRTGGVLLHRVLNAGDDASAKPFSTKSAELKGNANLYIDGSGNPSLLALRNHSAFFNEGSSVRTNSREVIDNAEVHIKNGRLVVGPQANLLIGPGGSLSLRSCSFNISNAYFNATKCNFKRDICTDVMEGVDRSYLGQLPEGETDPKGRINMFAGADYAMTGAYNNKCASLSIGGKNDYGEQMPIEIISGLNKSTPLGTVNHILVGGYSHLIMGYAPSMPWPFDNYSWRNFLQDGTSLVVVQGSSVLFADACDFRQTWGSRIWLNPYGIKYMNYHNFDNIGLDYSIWKIQDGGLDMTGYVYGNFSVFKDYETNYMGNEYSVINRTAADQNFTYMFDDSGNPRTDIVPAGTAKRYLCTFYATGQTPGFIPYA